jgi:hypothetical protein
VSENARLTGHYLTNAAGERLLNDLIHFVNEIDQRVFRSITFIAMKEGKLRIWDTLYKYKFHHILLWAAYFLFWVLVYYRYYPSLLGLIAVVAVYFFFNAAGFYITANYHFTK